jgi:L-lactate dehydrogenase
VKESAQRIIEAKKASYYGIGMAMVRISKAILGDENSVLTVSAMTEGEYGVNGVYVGVPCIINRNGVDSIITLTLTDEELRLLHFSSEILQKIYNEIEF